MSPQETHSNPTPVAQQMPTVSTPGLDCPACGTHNSSDSKFCRQCGQLLRALPNNDAKKAAPAPQDNSNEDDSERTSPAEIDARRARQLLDRALLLSERGDLNAALLACRQAVALDGKRAEPYALLGTLLERNGDMSGAVKAYERVLEIAPNNALERDSLTRLKARQEKAPAFHFNPDELFASDDDLPSIALLSAEEIVPFAAPPERDKHGIEARLPPTSASLRPSASTAPEAAPVATTPVAPAPAVVPAPVVAKPVPATAPASAPMVFDFDPAPTDTLPSVSPLAAALDDKTLDHMSKEKMLSAKPASSSPKVSPSGGAPKIERREGERRQVNVPVAMENRAQGERRTPATAPGAMLSPSVWPATASAQTARPATPAPAPVRPGLSNPTVSVAPTPNVARDFSFAPGPPVKTPLWAQMMRGSSFFARTLPLVAVGVLGLGFLSWARSQAVAGYTTNSTEAPTTVLLGNTTTVVQSVPQQQVASAPGSVVVPAPNGSGVPLTNATPAPVAPGASTANPATSTASNPTRVASSSSGGARPAPARPNAGAPSFPVPVAPAPVPAAPARGGGDNGTIVLPPPQTQNGGNAAPPIQVGSLGGAPLNPAGSPQEGRIRITQGTLVGRPAPPRSGTAARGEERAAAAASANGNQDRAINNLTNAINATGADQGFLLQQRAMAFLDRGDSARAAEDFNAAISAYQDQINRGENVPSAQAGIRSARAGLNQALSRR